MKSGLFGGTFGGFARASRLPSRSLRSWLAASLGRNNSSFGLLIWSAELSRQLVGRKRCGMKCRIIKNRMHLPFPDEERRKQALLGTKRSGTTARHCRKQRDQASLPGTTVPAAACTFTAQIIKYHLNNATIIACYCCSSDNQDIAQAINQLAAVNMAKRLQPSTAGGAAY